MVRWHPRSRFQNSAHALGAPTPVSSLGFVGMNLHLQTSALKTMSPARRTSGESHRWGVPNLALNSDAASLINIPFKHSGFPVSFHRAASAAPVSFDR